MPSGEGSGVCKPVRGEGDVYTCGGEQMNPDLQEMKVWTFERTSGFLTLGHTSCLEQGLLCPCPNPEAAFDITREIKQS